MTRDELKSEVLRALPRQCFDLAGTMQAIMAAVDRYVVNHQLHTSNLVEHETQKVSDKGG